MGTRKQYSVLAHALGTALIVAASLTALCDQAGALAPPYISYQGQILDPNGVPLQGSVAIEIGIWDTPSAGTLIYGEAHSGVLLSNGVFDLDLGSGAVLPGGIFATLSEDVFADPARYLEVTIEGEVLSPRQPIGSGPYALQCQVAETAGAATYADIAGDADTVDGSHAFELDQSEVLSTHEGDTAAHHTKTTHFTELTGQIAEGQLPYGIIWDAELTWENVSAKPAGFADNVDNDSGGTITQVTAGTGLTGGGTSGAVALSVRLPLHLSGSDSFDPLLPTFKVKNTGGGAGVAGENKNGDSYGELGSPGYGALGISSATAGVHGENLSSNTVGSLGEQWAGVHGKHVTNGNEGRIGSPWEGVRGDGNGSHRGGIFVSESGEGVRGASGSGYGGFFTSNADDLDLALGGARGRINSDPTNEHSELYLSSNHDVLIKLDNDGGENAELKVLSSGGTAVLKVNEAGRSTTGSLEITGGSDLSEGFDIVGAHAELPPSPGMAVSIDPEGTGNLVVSTEPYDRRVVGIISGAAGIAPGMLMGQRGSPADGTSPVALTGRVYCYADAFSGPIEPGDLLTTSATPGHAMKVTDFARAQGAILGKAMTSLEEGKGLVLVLVSLQ